MWRLELNSGRVPALQFAVHLLFVPHDRSLQDGYSRVIRAARRVGEKRPHKGPRPRQFPGQPVHPECLYLRCDLPSVHECKWLGRKHEADSRHQRAAAAPSRDTLFRQSHERSRPEPAGSQRQSEAVHDLPGPIQAGSSSSGGSGVESRDRSRDAAGRPGQFHIRCVLLQHLPKPVRKHGLRRQREPHNQQPGSKSGSEREYYPNLPSQHSGQHQVLLARTLLRTHMRLCVLAFFSPFASLHNLRSSVWPSSALKSWAGIGIGARNLAVRLRLPVPLLCSSNPLLI